MESIKEILTEELIHEKAVDCDFSKRESRKITPANFIYGLLNNVINGGNSLMSLAVTIGLIIDDTVSKVALNKKFNKELIILLEELLSYLINLSLNNGKKLINPEVLKKFKRVFIEDSTSFHLPPNAIDKYPGGGNQHKKISMARIQLVHDILRETLIKFQIMPYTKNDQSASKEILPLLQTDDLIIRDLGYFSLKVFKSIIEIGAYFLSRLRYNVNIYSVVTGKQMDIVELLKRGKKLDMQVLLGKKSKVPVRLVAIPLCDSVANKRRRKAKEKMKKDSRTNYSKEHLLLLGWEIFITNVDEDTWRYNEIADIYSLRWRIEIIFKSWKSGLKFLTIPKANATRIEAYLITKLIIITILHVHYYRKLLINLNMEEIHLSIQKMMKIISSQSLILNCLFAGREMSRLNIQRQIKYHCKYEKRYGRINHFQTLILLG